jgi:dCTP diphosphatase
MQDDHTTVGELRAAVERFVAARDWHRFHNAKDLAISIAIEAGELLEELQWQDAESVARASADPEARERMRLELADVLIYCFSLSNALDLDVSDAVLDKLVMAGQKYPASDYQGHYRRPNRRGDFTVD